MIIVWLYALSQLRSCWSDQAQIPANTVQGLLRSCNKLVVVSKRLIHASVHRVQKPVLLYSDQRFKRLCEQERWNCIPYKTKAVANSRDRKVYLPISFEAKAKGTNIKTGGTTVREKVVKEAIPADWGVGRSSAPRTVERKRQTLEHELREDSSGQALSFMTSRLLLLCPSSTCMHLSSKPSIASMLNLDPRASSKSEEQ